MINFLPVITALVALKLGSSLSHALILSLVIFLIDHLTHTGKINPSASYLILLMPLVWFKPQFTVVIWTLLLVSSLIWLFTFLKGTPQKIVILLLTFVFIYGCLISGGLLSIDGHLNQENFWWGKPDIALEIKTLRLQALYLPYQLRPLVFSPVIYLQKTIGNALGLLSPFYLSAMLAIVNLYLITTAILKIKKPTNFDFLALWLVSLSFLIAGFNRYADKYNSFYLLLPLVIYYQRLGFTNPNKKVLITLTIISLLILPGI